MNMIKLNCNNTHVDLGYHFGVSIETVVLTGPTIKFRSDTPSRPATTYDSLELSGHLIWAIERNMCQSLVRPVFSISGIFVVSGTPAVIGCGVKSAATLVHAFVDSYGRRCFAVAGPSTWKSLPDSLRDQLGVLAFSGVTWKNTFFLRNIDETHILSALDFFYENVLYKFTLYLLTYLLTIRAWESDLLT